MQKYTITITVKYRISEYDTRSFFKKKKIKKKEKRKIKMN